MHYLVIYNTTYGTTARYAQALARGLSGQAISQKEVTPEDLQKADVVILGSNVRAMGLGFGSLVKKHAKLLSKKHLLFFCVGASPKPDEGDGILNALRQRAMGDLFQDAPLFYCRGAWDLHGMKLIDKMLCKLLLRMLKKKDPSTMAPWEKALNAAGERKASWYDENYLLPILEAAKAGE